VSAPAGGQARVMPDPGLWRMPEMRAALAARDISRVYLILRREGVPAWRIGELTDQSQHEVSAIMQGRRVKAYDVLVTIMDGLGVPRGLAGLASCRCEEKRREAAAVRREIMAGYRRLRKDPAAWASYLTDSDEEILP
jgi:hypothetical protein